MQAIRQPPSPAATPSSTIYKIEMSPCCIIPSSPQRVVMYYIAAK